MTQAINLANFSNNLDSSGTMNPGAINAPVAVAKGGTNASNAADARTNLGVPSLTGTGASGNWAINAQGLVGANFQVIESGTKLLIKYGSTTIGSIDSSGNLIVTGNVTAYGTP